ncbi:diguanylate cyclase [Sphingomonas sp. OK281]|uniref:diguanylate cyclase n=1 Tax=Sphingomonas sp. OK281 TaxID=1881067 RepID=UPI0008DFF55C|nr:diguanylate cyclase [Sphingomonas sp. OK281]SFO03711.1 diguanylate cyclase (GGDEF) domain-containing protein [Sphingomonas sp. OK281]
MRLVTITNWAYGITVALTLASGTTMLLASSAQDRERAAVNQRYALDRATASIEDDVLALSELARQFAINGETADLLAFQRGRAELRPIEQRTRHIRDAGAGEDELASLHQALRWADALQAQQQQAVEARRRDDRTAAVGILFAPEYERELDRSRAAVERFQYRLDQRTGDELRAAESTARAWRSASEAMLAITGLLFLFVLYFVFRRRVLHPVVRLSDVIGRLAAQDYDAEPPKYERIDEIGDMAKALQVFRENGIERQRLEQERDVDRAVRDLLSRMTQRMQGCDTVAELETVVSRFVPKVAPHLAGCLFLLDTTRNVYVAGCSWLDPAHSTVEFSPFACWGVRRGAAHRPSGDAFDVPCDHIVGDALPDSVCLPLVGQNGMLGLLYFERRDDTDRPTLDQVGLNDVYLQMLAENIGLALDNLRLREALRSLAMADPLTMLPNRRQLDDVLARTLVDAERNGTPVSCAMIDIDHFKRFNDDHGHDAGDAVLRAVGATLKDAVRDANLVFRYGGEEFLLLLPGLTADVAADRAEDIRARIGAMRVQYEGRDLGPVTVSIGVAGAPLHADWQSVVQTADAALFRAKQAGRNRVLPATARQRVA